MYFTLAVSAASGPGCASLTRAALDTDPRVMPIAGPARVAWRSADGCSAMVHWGAAAPAPSGDYPARSHAGTIWTTPAALHGRTSVTRTDPVFVTETQGGVVISDRASWAAVVTGHLSDRDQVMIAALLNLGYPLGDVTPFRGVRAVGGARSLRATAGRLTIQDDDLPETGADAAAVAAALVDVVTPLADSPVPTELSLTGGKDSRLIAAALTAAKVPFRARTHGAPDHPDVVVARTIAARLGIEHSVTSPAPPGSVTTADVLYRLRAAVLVGDGMLSAFENVGRPDPVFAADCVLVGGHGGELLRGGYASHGLTTARAAVRFRRLTTRRLRLLRPATAAAYLARLSPWASRFARGPLRALDDFYLVNRAGRWSAVARQAYLLRSDLIQPFFGDQVVRAARSVPLSDRVNGRLHRDVLAGLCPDLLDIPLAGRRPAAADWRRAYGDDTATFLRGYVLDQGSELFGVVSKRAAERVLDLPHTDHETVWALATLAALLSGDWLSLRQPAPRQPRP
jgi:hypothetical protein